MVKSPRSCQLHIVAKMKSVSGLLAVFFYIFFVGGIFSDELPHQEEPCSATGGMCYQEKFCGDVPQKGLCPQQQKNGVECCFQITGPTQKTPSDPGKDCGLTGICREQCPDNLIEKIGSCKNNFKCCTLV